MKGIQLIGVLALAACASTRDTLAEAPTEVFYSEKSLNQVAFCLSDNNNTPALERDDGSKVVVIRTRLGGVSMAFSIYPNGKGSRIEQRKKFGTIGGVWKQCVGLKPES